MKADIARKRRYRKGLTADGNIEYINRKKRARKTIKSLKNKWLTGMCYKMFEDDECSFTTSSFFKHHKELKRD